jgi:hypothetical protein
MLRYSLPLGLLLTIAIPGQVRTEVSPPPPISDPQDITLEKIKEMIANSQRSQNIEIYNKLTTLQTQISQLVPNFATAMNEVKSINGFVTKSGEVIERSSVILDLNRQINDKQTKILGDITTNELTFLGTDLSSDEIALGALLIALFGLVVGYYSQARATRLEATTTLLFSPDNSKVIRDGLQVWSNKKAEKNPTEVTLAEKATVQQTLNLFESAAILIKSGALSGKIIKKLQRSVIIDFFKWAESKSLFEQQFYTNLRDLVVSWEDAVGRPWKWRWKEAWNVLVGKANMVLKPKATG